MNTRRNASMGRTQKAIAGLGLTLILALTGCPGGGSGTTPGSNATLSSIAVTPANPSIGVGAVQNFNATGTYSDGSTQNLTSSAVWSSSAATVVAIQTGKTNPGVATGVTAGSAMITATDGSVSGSTPVTVAVKTSAVTSIAVTPAPATVAVGDTRQFTATGTESNGSKTDITSFVTWTSSNTTNATIQTTGQTAPGAAKGVAVGNVTITATASDGVSGTATLTVSAAPPPLVSILVGPPSTYLAVGSTAQFTAVGTYSDGSSKDVTSTAGWTSSNTEIATVETTGAIKPGQATAVAMGSVTITGSLSGLSSSATLTITNTGVFTATPLMDMVVSNGPCATYKSFPGGLYENCSNTIPADHGADGQAIASQVVPLDANGNPNANGEIVFTSIGMSAALAEFAPFITMAEVSPSVNNATVAIFNGSASLQDACDWFPAEGPPTCDSTDQNNYDRIASSMATGGRDLTALQIQVAWIDEENGRVHVQERGCQPLGTECVPLCDETISGCSNTPETTDALNLEQELGNILRASKQRWPNLKLVFFNSRIYGGYAINGSASASPEPFAYESGFAVKWLIEAQINQIRTGTIDPIAGDLSYANAPWIAWGPYTWASGPIPRSDGLVWCDGQATAPCSGELDFDPDGVHPNVTGATKVANMLMSFFLNSPFTQSWFAAQ